MLDDDTKGRPQFVKMGQNEKCRKLWKRPVKKKNHHAPLHRTTK